MTILNCFRILPPAVVLDVRVTVFVLPQEDAEADGECRLSP
jgi:hypothetical protein